MSFFARMAAALRRWTTREQIENAFFKDVGEGNVFKSKEYRFPSPA